LDAFGEVSGDQKQENYFGDKSIIIMATTTKAL